MNVLTLDYRDERALRAAFSWLTRTGAGPAFGSRPIGWYQQHQCKALDILESAVTSLVGNGQVRVFHGFYQYRGPGVSLPCAWYTLKLYGETLTPSRLFDLADKAIRG